MTTWAFSNWLWWKAGSRSTSIQPTILPTGFSPIHTPPCRAPRISRVSELLQAQLLQPLNSNPVQPRLGESAPAVLSGAGPVDPAFNEFSQLFIRDRLQFLGAGISGRK